MRYFLAIFAFTVLVVLVTAGRRGDLSRRPPLEVFPDMDRQPKLRPQAPNLFFPDGLSSRLPVPETIARTRPHEIGGFPIEFDGQPVYPYEETPVNTGRVAGTTNFIENIPVPVNEALLARGRQRFQIYCSPCHGAQADGNGVTKRYGMATVANLHEARIVKQPDGELFHTITFGKNLMGAYGSSVPVPDRWAIIAYLRALQRSRLAAAGDAPSGVRSQIPNWPPPGAAGTNAPGPGN